VKKLTKDNLNTQEFWEDEAKKGYLEKYFNSYLSEGYLKAILKEITTEDKVLDVACGSGVLTKYLGNVDGCDFSEYSIKWVHKKLGLKTFHCDLNNKIPVKKDSYDILVATEVLEHLDNPKKVIKEMARVAKRKIIVSVPYDNGGVQSEEHKWLFTPKDIVELLEPYGKYTVMVEDEMSRIIGVVDLPQEYIVDADDFCESNDGMNALMFIKGHLPNFKINLFTIPGLCSQEFLDKIKKLDWIDMIPHGLVHTTPRECEKWTYDESMTYLDVIEPLGLEKGFKAPGWQISDGMYKALLERGYWVADKDYNDKRRPKMKSYLIDDRNKLHFHIGHMGGHNTNEISEFANEIIKLNGSFKFIKDERNIQN